MARSVKISVVTVTYNCAHTINDCLDTVAAQTYANREHVVIDGASKDGTADLLRQRQAQLAVLVSERDRGIYDALNKGIERCSGNVVGFMHADDVYGHNQVLEHVAKLFEDERVDAVYGDLQYVRKDDMTHVVRHWQSKPFTPQALAWGWMPPHPTLYVRRSAYAQIGGFDIGYKIAADYDSILKLFTLPNFNAVYLPEVLVKMRLGGASNRSLKNIIRKSREDLHALRRARVGALGGFGALAWKNLSKLKQFK